MSDYYGSVYARADLTISTTTVQLPAATIHPLPHATTPSARAVVIYVEAQPIRWTSDGTAVDDGASPPVGQVAAAGSSFTLVGSQQIRDFQCEREGDTDAVLHAEFYR